MINKKTQLALALALASSATAQAATYTVTGIFDEPMTNGVNTEFHGTFDWDGSTVSNFTGTMNESMRGLWTDNPANDYIDFPNYVGTGVKTDMYPTQNTFNGQKNYITANHTYMLHLDQNLIQSDAAGTVTATIFKENTSDVYSGGGYAGDPATNNFMKYGSMGDGFTPNQNAFFTLVFSHDGSGNITSLGLAGAGLLDQMVYGDCTVGSLMMGPGTACMAGEVTGMSMMAATPASLNIQAVPVPAAVWLLGSALAGMGVIGRRKDKAVA